MTPPTASWMRFRTQEAGYRSFDQLAQQVLAEWKRVEPRSPKCSARALGVKIGGLDKPERRPEILAWWRNHAVAEQALASTLSVPVEDLPTKVGGASASRLFPLGESDVFRPFDPLRETPLALGERDRRAHGADLLAPLSKGDWSIECEWVVTPPGAGRSFAVHWFRTREAGRVQAREVPTLAEAQPLLAASEPVLLAVDAADPATDAAIAARFAARGRVRVLAPFPPPGIGDEATSLSEGERKLRAFRWAVGRPWQVRAWKGARGWRRQYLAWLAERTTGAHLDADALHDWIERHDPAGTEFATPGDLLPLAAFATVVPPAKLPGLNGLAARFVGKQAERAESAWLRANAVEVTEALAGALLSRIDFGWRQPVPRERWAEMLPAGMAPPPVEDRLVDQALREVATPRTAEARQKAVARVKEQLVGADAGVIVRNLESLRLLRNVGAGLVLNPPWLAAALARSLIVEAFREHQPASWGRWAVDASRRSLVDAAADALHDAPLLRLVQRVVESHDLASLGSVGAVETIFAAVGRRLDVDRRLASPWLQRLAQQQIALLRRGDQSPQPVTRPRLDDLEDKTDFLAACWAWSLWTDSPEAHVPDELAWLFPRWSSVSLASQPGWCAYASEEPPPAAELPEGGGREQVFDFDRELARAWLRRNRRRLVSGAPTARDRLLALAPLVLQHCADAELPAEPSRMNKALLAAAVLAAPRWPLPFRLIEFLLGSPPAEPEREPVAWAARPEKPKPGWAAYLGDRLAALPQDRQQVVAEALWTSVADHEAGLFPTLDMLWRSIDLYDFVVDRVSDEAVVQALDRHGVDMHELWRRLFHLPPRFRLPTVRWVIQHKGDEAALLGLAVASAGPDDLAWIEALLDWSPGAATNLLWRVAPDRALERARKAPPDTAAAWLAQAPTEWLGPVLDHLEGLTERPAWVEHWARLRLHDAGPIADRVWALLRPGVSGE
jgi:hypothetical protein